ATGAHPYEVEFSGSLGDSDLPELEARAVRLSGGSASIPVGTSKDGGEGVAHGATEEPVSAATLGKSGIASVPVSGLEPGTAYRFRVIAESACKGSEQAPCVTAGAPVGFSTYPEASAVLPDGRAYELVS